MKKAALMGLMVLTIFACKKDHSSSSSTRSGLSTADLQVPANFSWRTTQTVAVDPSSVLNGSDETRAFKIYDQQGNLLATRTMAATAGSRVYLQLPINSSELYFAHDKGMEKLAVHNGYTSANNFEKKNGTSCDCEHGMQYFKVVYSGPSGVNVDAADKKANSPFQTFANVQNGDTLTVDDPNNFKLPKETQLTVGNNTVEIHTSCSQDIMGVVFGDFTVVEFLDGDGDICNSVPPPTINCPCNHKMQNFTVYYNGPANATLNLREKDKFDPKHFKGSTTGVNPGDSITFYGYDKNGRFKAKVFIEIDSVFYEIHTSCSRPILGDIYGPLTVTAYTDGTGFSCSVTPPPCVDSDNDGCCDSDDAFPNDPTLCDIQYIPGNNVYGSYAYEDLWPNYGDFDFNDKVIDRNTVLQLDQNGDVTQAVYKLVLRAAGAGFLNGFGFALPGVAPNAVSSVSGTMNPQGYTIIEANGTEAGQSEAVIIVYENWRDVVTITQPGQFFNTLNPGGGLGTSDTITITVDFALAQPVANLLEIDPFLIRNGIRGAEIHLPWFGPTDLANLSLFGQRDDASSFPNPGNNYVSATNIPWAIETPQGAFDWPIEYEDIRNVYFDFDDWASTGLPVDWYSNGNRDNSKVY